MPDVWQDRLLGDLVTFQRGYDITKKQQESGPYPVISSSGASSTHREAKVVGPGVVIGRKGSLGGVYYSSTDFWPHDTTLWVKDFHGNDPRFTFYFLKTLGLERFDVGASNPTINRNHIHQIPVRAPAVETQRKIGGVLAAYDELIKNNLRRIEILEEMAQAIYREWFVNFRYSGYDSDGYATDGGWTSSGWDEVPLDQIVTPLRSHVDPSKHPDTDFVHYSFAAFDAGRVPSQDVGRDLKSGKLAVERPSVLLAKLNPRIPRVWMVEPPSDVPAIASSEFLVLVPADSVPLSYAYCLLKDMSVSGRLAVMAGGTSTSHQRLKQQDLLSMVVALPSPTALKSFDDAVAPMLGLAVTLIAMNENLRATRDLLLPKLVSGEIDVSDLDIDTSWLAA